MDVDRRPPPIRDPLTPLAAVPRRLPQRKDRLRAYELVLREGTPSDIEAIVDGVLLCEAWPDLTLPRALRAAWTPLIHAEGDLINLAAAS